MSRGVLLLVRETERAIGRLQSLVDESQKAVKQLEHRIAAETKTKKGFLEWSSDAATLRERVDSAMYQLVLSLNDVERMAEALAEEMPRERS